MFTQDSSTCTGTVWSKQKIALKFTSTLDWHQEKSKSNPIDGDKHTYHNTMKNKRKLQWVTSVSPSPFLPFSFRTLLLLLDTMGVLWRFCRAYIPMESSFVVHRSQNYGEKEKAKQKSADFCQMNEWVTWGCPACSMDRSRALFFFISTLDINQLILLLFPSDHKYPSITSHTSIHVLLRRPEWSKKNFAFFKYCNCAIGIQAWEKEITSR